MFQTPARRLTAGIAAVGTGAALTLSGIALPAQAAAPTGGDIVSNGDFENDTWQTNETGEAVIVDDQAHDGSHSIKATGRSTTGSGPMQQLGGKMSAGLTYELSYWVYYDGETAPATKNFWATAKYADAQKDEYGPYNKHVNLVQGQDVPKGQWTQVTGEFTIPADREDVSVFDLFFETPYVASPTPEADLLDFYVDDVDLHVKGETRNLVAAGGLEDPETSPWIPRGDTTTLSYDTTDAATGSGSLLVDGRAATHDGVAQSVPVEAGATYDVSFKVKYDDPAMPDTLKFQGSVDYGSDSGGSQYVNVLAGDAKKGEWSTISGSMEVPEGRDLSALQFYVENVYGAAEFPGSYRLDDVSITKSSSDGPAPEAPADPFESHNTAEGSFGAFAKTSDRGNPLVTQTFGADPWAMEYDGRLYVYTTNDRQEWNDYLVKGEDNNYGNINQLNVWSSADMVNWTNHGAISAAGAKGLDTSANNSWAPAATHKTIDGKEKFFLYFANNGGGIHVLEGDSPTGPWTAPRTDALVGWDTPGVRGLEGANDVAWLFDPAVFIDDDGQAYLYFGGGVPEGKDDSPKTGRVIKLGDDMVSTEGSAQLVDAPGLFEDSGIHKVGDKYYYSYCTNFTNNLEIGRGNIAYMEADSPMGPWTESTFKGLVFPNQSQFFGVGGNNHHAIFQFRDEWYIIYHAQTLDKEFTGGHGFRNAHIDKIDIAEDGTITPVTGTYEGIEQLQDVDAYAAPIPAETIAWQSGTQQGYDGGTGIGASVPESILTSVNHEDWTSLSNVDFGDGAASVSAKVRAGAGGTIKVRTSADQTDDSNVVATMDVPAGDGSTWTEVSADVAEGALTGVQDVYFTYSGAAGETSFFDVSSWTFAAADGADTRIPSETTAEPKGKIKVGKDRNLKVTVTAEGAVPTGEVTVYAEGSDEPLGTGTLDAEGVATVKVPFTEKGETVLRVEYAGDETVAASGTEVTVTVS